MAQSLATGRIWIVKPNEHGHLIVTSRKGYDPSQIDTSLDTGIIGSYPAIVLDDSEAKYAIFYINAHGYAVVSQSVDQFNTLSEERVIFDNHKGIHPFALFDSASGIWHYWLTVSNNGKDDIVSKRESSIGANLKWSDGIVEKRILEGLIPAGRVTVILDTYKSGHPLQLIHGNSQYISTDSGETWTA